MVMLPKNRKIALGAQPGAVSRLAGVARSGPDYSAVTVKGIMGQFYRRFEDVLSKSWASRIALIIPSNQEVETYRLLGMVPAIREWKGGRLLKALRTDGFTITNKPFEGTLPFSLEDWRRDKTGQLMIRMGDLARRAAQHPEALITTAIEANGLSYDGQNFFDTDHALGSSGTQINALAAAQVPALNVVTAAAPTEDEMVDVLIGVISYQYGLKDDQGEPINGDAKKWIVMVPPNLMGSTQAAIRSKLRKSGSDAATQHQDFEISCIVNPRLTSATVFYVFREDVEMKSMILQEELAPETQVIGEGSEEAFKNRRILAGVFCSRNVGYGEPLHAAKCTLS